jgi:ribose transport system permease protein
MPDRTPDKHQKEDARAVALRPSAWTRVRSIKELSVFGIVVALFVALTFLSPFFLTSQNLRTLAIGLAAEGIVVVGMTIALASGGFDLSVGSVMGLSAIVAAYLYTQGVDIWTGALAGLISGVIVGVVNGALISRVGVNPFITTLGTLTVARGLVYVISDGSSQ